LKLAIALLAVGGVFAIYLWAAISRGAIQL
jgi:hypothetical protein